MARVRQARKCRARRKNGQPCGNYAMIGAYVCRLHGGASPRARRAARMRVIETQCLRMFEDAKRRWRVDMVRWQAERILVTSRMLGIAPQRVTAGDIFECRIVHGVPARLQPVMRHDRRYGPRRPGRY